MSVPETDVEFELRQIIKDLRAQLTASKATVRELFNAVKGDYTRLKEKLTTERERADRAESIGRGFAAQLVGLTTKNHALEQQLAAAKGDVAIVNWLLPKLGFTHQPAGDRGWFMEAFFSTDWNPAEYRATDEEKRKALRDAAREKEKP